MDTDILTWFLLADKPEWANPLDLLITAYLLTKADDEWKSAPRVMDISRTCGVVQRQSVRDSLRRLEQQKWITITYRQGIGLPNEYTVLVENLPRFDHQSLAKEKRG